MIHSGRLLNWHTLFAATFIVTGFFEANVALAQTAPQLTSISLTSPATLTAGNAVSYGFAITPGTAGSISNFLVTIQDPSGHQYTIQQSGQASGTVSGSTTSTWLNGNYTVVLMEIDDPGDYRAVYYPNGTISYPFGGSGPSTSSISFAALGFTVTGGVNSIAAPQLTSISLTSPATLAAGNTVSYGFAITPGTAGSISNFTITLQDPSGHQYTISQFGQASGTVSGATTSTWLNGNYTVVLMEIDDPGDYRAVYYPNGTISYPFGGSGPSTSSISFAALGFTVTGGVNSIAAPQLTSISLTSPATLAAGNTVSYGFAITPGTAGSISNFTITLQDPSGHQYTISQFGQASGTVSGATTSTWLNGNYTVVLMEIDDPGDYRAVYYPNGTISYPFGGSGPSTSSISFAALGFTVTGGVNLAPSITAQPSNQQVIVGQTASFTLAAIGVPTPTYQWQRMASGSSIWSNLSDGGTYSGSATANLTISGTTTAMSGDQFRCVVSNSVSGVTSNAATLTVASVYTFTTLAGSAGSSGAIDGGGGSARFYNPQGIAVDSAGNVYVADTNNHTVRKITSGGVVTTLAGSATAIGSTDGIGSAARFFSPSGVAVDSSGNIYVSDWLDSTIRKITSGGMVTTLAGSAGHAGSSNGTGSAAEFNAPNGLAVDSADNVYVADTNNDTIRKITSAGVVTTLAGSAGSSGSTNGTGGAARFNSPEGVAVDGAGNVYVADYSNQVIRKVTSSGVVTTLAGTAGVAGSTDGSGSVALFFAPRGVAVDSAGNVYVADTLNETIREIANNGVVTTLAGSVGNAGSTDGTGSTAEFDLPFGVAVDSAGNLFVADQENSTIRWGAVGPPNLTSATTATGTYGQSFTYTATFSGALSNYTESGLPAGLSLNATTGAITGIPTVVGTYLITLDETNGAGVSSGTLTLTIGAGLPGTPTAVSVAAGNGQATVSFTPPVSTGGVALTGYTVTATPSSGSPVTATGAFSPIIVTGLTNGTAYTFAVTASNTTGSSNSSTAPSSITPNIPPSLTTQPVLSDQFTGSGLNSSNWTSSTPYSDSSAAVASGNLSLSNGEGIISASSYSTPTEVDFAFTFTGGSYDSFRVYTRAGEFNSGGYGINGVGVSFRIQDDTGNRTGNIALEDNGAVLTTGTFALAKYTYCSVRLVDTGSSLVLYLNSSSTPFLTAATTSSYGNKIGSFNRQGAGSGSGISAGSVTALDYLTVSADPLPTQSVLNDQFTDLGLNSSNWTASTPYSDSNAAVASGNLSLSNGEGIISANSYSTPTEVDFAFAFTGGSYDSFRVYTRAGRFNSGGYGINGVGVSFRIQDDTGNRTGNIALEDNGAVLTTGTFALAKYTYCSVRLVDTGSSLVLYLNSSSTPFLTAATTSSYGNKIGSFNRQGAGSGSSISAGSVTALDYVTVWGAPLPSEPVSITETAGAPASFTVVASGAAPLSYQWYKNGSAISGATSASYSITAVSASDAGNYTITVSNLIGNTTSTAGTLTVNPAPASVTLTSSTLNQTYTGSPLAVSATTNPSGLSLNFTYTGIGGTTYATSSTAPTQVGTYSVTATVNNANYTGSASGTLTITPALPGTYFGSFGASSSSSRSSGLHAATAGVGTNIAAQINAAGTGGILVGYISSINAGFAVSFALNADDSFTATTVTLTGGTSSSRTLTFAGDVANGVISGTIEELSLTFSATLDASSGTSAAVSGFYQASSSGSSGAATYSIVGSQGDVFALAVTSSGVSAGTGTVSSNGVFTVVTQTSATISGTVNASSDTLTGTITPSSGGPIAFSGATAGPSFTLAASPATTSIATGHSVAFNALATGTPTPTYQWTLNGSTTIPGAAITTDPVLLISGATSADIGTLTCTATNTQGSGSTSATLSVITTSTPGYLINLSARADVLTGNNLLIVGLGVTGSGTEPMLIRGDGPSVVNVASSLAGQLLPNPALTLFDNHSVSIISDTGWGNALVRGSSTASVSPIPATTALFTSVGAFGFLSATSPDSAMEFTSASGSYTAEVIDANGATGIALAEIYDAGNGTSARLNNISARADVGAGGNILIGGFNIAGSTSETVLVRGDGPAMGAAPFNLSGFLTQPTITIYSGSVPLYTNTGWGNDPVIASTVNPLGAFALANNSADCALLVTLPPGGYTVLLSGAGGTSGIGLVEIYEVP